MIQIDLPPLVKRLNLFSRQALEMAASECMSQQAAEITVSHVLIQMLAMPRSDLRVITRQGDIGMEELRQALTVENYTTARSADSYPAFSPMLVEWLKEGWLLASAEMQHSELRGGVLLLAGPSGVGKTETVLQLAELLYGGRQYLTTINMSEFQEKHTVSRLIGSPPGYVGYGEGGVLTEAIRQKPYSVVLLDEVEKAHPDVLNLFYQAFDKGEMADGEGRLIDCKNIVFFLTSNLGYQVIVEHADDPETMQEVLYPVLADFFKPALLARMEVVPYLPLSKETLATIIAGKLARLDNVLRSRFGAEVVIEPEVTDEIMSRVTRAENGARMLESVIDGDMLPPLSLLLLQKMAANTAIARIRLSAVDGAFTADVEDAQNDESVTKDETVL
ncbi:AAA domain-containing protein [Escherichia coli]|nr:AAA domain-containing protein [Escherichia coli]HAI1344127.1 AAA domain-containing protein [Escherichia coli]HBE5531049.1 AAA family ATPase [Escherichia coli]